MTKSKTNIGIIAGEGKFPVLIAKEAKAKGIGVFVAGSKGNAKEEDFKPYADKFKTLSIGSLGGCIKFFKENNVTEAVMAGRVQHFSIFSFIPDIRAAKAIAKIRDMRPSSILNVVLAEFSKEGIEFKPSHMFLEKFVPPKGLLSVREPSEEEAASIELGFKVAKTLADLDVGLTCVLADRAVIAVEGMEGTDNCIKRGGALYKNSRATKGSLVVVKVARSNQDTRYDLPVIGKGTIKSLLEAGVKVLAFEADKTLVLDLDEVISQADKHKIVLIAV